MIYGKIERYDGQTLRIVAPYSDSYVIEKQAITEVELTLIDGRTLSADQRKKVYAMLRDISNYTGHTTEELKDWFKAEYISRTGEEWFSLSDCNMTTARCFIDMLVEFCIVWDVPCRDSLLGMAEDVGKYLYLCLISRKCCICGKSNAHIHHVDRIGLGAKRREMCHVGYEAMALCWKHHQEAHTMGKAEFNARHHVFGIKLDEYLCKTLKLGRCEKYGDK